jgi:signal peptidase I
MVPPQSPEGHATTRVPLEVPPESRWGRTFRELVTWLRTLMSAAVYATLIVTFIGQAARVEGRSMLPTLEDQDRLIVNKMAYLWDKPQVGDIVMVASPREPDQMLVKRVIAGPGDIVRSVDGRVYRNDVPVLDAFVPDEYRSYDTWGPRVVPEGFYFVLGDHRNDSLDSRMFGPVPEKYIRGRVQLRWWPLGHGRVF